MRNPNLYSCILANFNLFQPNTEVSAGCSNNAAMCISVEMSHLGSNEEISSHSIWKLKGPPSFVHLILWMVSQNILDDICLLNCPQEPTNGSGFPSLSWGIPPISNQIRSKENRDSRNSSD